jgi:hypothetical protein
VGAAFGTAVITTIAANYTTITSATRDPLAQVVHGYAAAGAWGAGILVVTAIGLAVLMRSREPADAAEVPGEEVAAL